MKDRNSILEMHRETVGVDSAKARELIKKLDYKEDYLLLQCIAQTYLDEGLLTKNNKMCTYIDKRKLCMAERYMIKAYEINADDLRIIYTMGKVRKVYGQLDLAIYLFKKVIKSGMKGRSASVDGNKLSKELAMELINDK